MHFLNQALIGQLCLAICISAFELTLYKDVPQCSANSDTTYRIIQGPSNNTCYNLDASPEEMNLLWCDQYNNGGAEGPVACAADHLVPASVRQKNGPRTCQFFSKRDCDGTLHEVAGDGACLTGADVGIEGGYQSFRCDWDDSVDILAEVGCHDGVSTNVCVEDCLCKCVGQRLICVADKEHLPLGCTLEAGLICQEQCVCYNP